jgi:hypothetical protein
LLGLNKNEERNLIVAEAGRRKTEGVFKQAAAPHEFCKERTNFSQIDVIFIDNQQEQG